MRARNEEQKARDRAASAAYRKANPESVKAGKNAWYQANKERVCAERRASYPERKAQEKAAARRWRTENPEKLRAQRLRKYGMSYERYCEMLKEQDGRCAICRGTQTGKKKSWSVDHCHSTGRIRGLLCQWCNRGIGIMRDDPKILRAAADYLEIGAAHGRDCVLFVEK